MKSKYLLTVLVLLAALLAAVSPAGAETKGIGAFTVEVLDEDAMTVRIVDYHVPREFRDEGSFVLNVPGELGGYSVKESGENGLFAHRDI